MAPLVGFSRSAARSCGVCLGLLLVGLVAGAVAADGAKYGSPAEVYEALQKTEQFDPGQVDVFTTGAIEEQVKFLVMMMSRGTPTTLPAEMEARRAAFLKKYGLYQVTRKEGETDDQVVARLMGGIADKGAMLREYLAIQKATSKPMPATTRPAVVLQEVKMSQDGNTATGKLVQRSGRSSSSMEVKFRKVEGSWKIDQGLVMR